MPSSRISPAHTARPFAVLADRKSTMPMLANVWLRTQGKNQRLIAALTSTSR